MTSLRLNTKKFRRLFRLVLVFAFSLTTGCTGSGFDTATSLVSKSASSVLNFTGSTSGYVGVNVSSVGDYSSQFFADAMKSGRYWGQPSTPCWGAAGPALDTNGWPMADTGMCVISGAIFIEIGTYSLSFTGQAKVVADLDAKVTVQNSVYNAATNTTTADVVAVEGANAIMLSFTNTRRLATDSSATGITNVKLMRPGQNNQVFSQLLLDRVQPASTLRLMDLMQTNGSMDATWAGRRIPSYAVQKTIPGAIAQGVAWEYVIQFANTTGKDIWINIPELATNDYVTKLAQLFRYGSDINGNVYTSPQVNPYWAPLNSNVRVYMEYSNELWNGMFVQSVRNVNRGATASWVAGKAYAYGAAVDVNGSTYVCIGAISSSTTAPSGTAQSIADGSGTWAYAYVTPAHLAFDNSTNQWSLGYRFTMERIITISNIFRAQFGDTLMGTQVKPIFASQLYYAVYDQGFSYYDNVYGAKNTFGNPTFPLNHYVFGLAAAPYYSAVSLSGYAWPASCATTMSTCTSYVNTKGYAVGSYVSAGGNLYQVASAVSPAWTAGTIYYSGSTVISDGHLYVSTMNVNSATTAPTGTGTGIVDGTGKWNYVKDIAARTQPAGVGGSITDSDGTWNYIYTYGDTAAETTQAFIDLNAMVTGFTNGSAATTPINNLVAWAVQYGLDPMAYEGGLDTSGAPNFESLVISDAFQNDPRMGTLMQNFYNVWFAAGGKLMNYYNLSGLYGQYGTWGLMQNLSIPTTVRMQTFVQEATMTSLPALTKGNILPTSLDYTTAYVNTGFMNLSRVYYHASAGQSTRWEMNAQTAGTFKFTTNIYSAAMQLQIDGVDIGTLPVGTSQSLTAKLSVGMHALVMTPVAPAEQSFDPIVVTKQ